MKAAYPVVMSKEEKYFIVHIPDFDISTQGTSVIDAIEMARDAIGLMGIVMEDENEALPAPSELNSVRKRYPPDNIVTLVDVDFHEYRRKNDQRAVKKNCTIPSWLCFEAEKAGINFSAILQNALKQELNITDSNRK